MGGGEFLNQAGYSGELIAGEGMGNDEDSAMGPLVIEKPNSEPNEIIPIPGHDTSFLRGSKVELPLVRCPAHPCLVSTERVNSALSKNLGNLGAEILIQVKLHNDDLIKG